jgi:hypothetical protein
MASDPHLGSQRPFGLGYWPMPEDDPGVELPRESIRIITPDRALVRGVLWRAPVGVREKKTAVILSHPRGDFSVHYACPLLAAAGYATFGFGTRYQNNDTDCLHEACVTALTQKEHGCGDGFLAMAAHPGEGVFMGHVIDPSVADEGDPFSTIPELDMYNPDNGWKPWPNPVEYDRAWLARYRIAQIERIARIDAIAKASIAEADDTRTRGMQLDRNDPAWRELRRRGVFTKYMVTYRTLADPAYLDLSIEPDDRPLGSLFAFPDPFEANYGRGGLARTMTARGWLSTWSALSSHAKLADTMPFVKVPTMIVHPTADTEIRVREALEIRDASGAADLTYLEMKGALHYLEGSRREAMDAVVDWMNARYN